MPNDNPFKPVDVSMQTPTQGTGFGVKHVSKSNQWQQQVVAAAGQGLLTAHDKLNNSPELVEKGRALARQGLEDDAIREENSQRLDSVWTAPAIKRGIQSVRTQTAALEFSDAVRVLQNVDKTEGGFSGLSSVEAARKVNGMIDQQKFDDPTMQKMFNEHAQADSKKFLAGHQERYLKTVADEQVNASVEYMYAFSGSVAEQYSDALASNPNATQAERAKLLNDRDVAYIDTFNDTMSVLPTNDQRNKFAVNTISDMIVNPATHDAGMSVYQSILDDPQVTLTPESHNTIKRSQSAYANQKVQADAFTSATRKAEYESSSKDYGVSRDTYMNRLQADSQQFGWGQDTIARYIKQFDETQVLAVDAAGVLSQAMSSGNAGDSYQALSPRGKEVYQDMYNDQMKAAVDTQARNLGIAVGTPEYDGLYTLAKLTNATLNPSMKDTGLINDLSKHMAVLRTGVSDPNTNSVMLQMYDMAKHNPAVLNNMSEDDQALLMDIGDRLQISPESISEIITTRARVDKAVIPKTKLQTWETDLTTMAFNKRQDITETTWSWLPFTSYRADGIEQQDQMAAVKSMAMDVLRTGKTDNVNTAWAMGQARFDKGSSEILGVKVPTGNRSMASRLGIDSTYPADVVVAAAVDSIAINFKIPDKAVDIDYNMSAGRMGTITVFDKASGEHVITLPLDQLKQYIAPESMTEQLDKLNDDRNSALQAGLLGKAANEEAGTQSTRTRSGYMSNSVSAFGGGSIDASGFVN
jgi:hypothetical protein